MFEFASIFIVLGGNWKLLKLGDFQICFYRVNCICVKAD